jgi:diguanylate cyclase (GGDEF)-like protein/PAS domain S-box-containing protein
MANTYPQELERRVEQLERELIGARESCAREIEEARERYQRVLSSTSEGFLELDTELRITDCNAIILDLLGYRKEYLLSERLPNLYDKESVFAHFASKNHLSFEANFRTATDDRLPLLCKRSQVRDTDGTPLGHLVLLTDLTELRITQANLAKARARYQRMYENAVQGMYQCSFAGNFISANPSLAQILEFASVADLLDHPGGVTSLYRRTEDRQRMLAVLREQGVVKNFEAEMVSSAGRPIWALINARVAEDAHGEAIIEGILIDNTTKRRAEDKLRKSKEKFKYLANRDSLTNLYNTRYLYKKLDSVVVRSRQRSAPFSLVFLDMDDFKTVVDTHGHLNGSQALKEVARTLKESLEKPAFGVAYGGDEFVLVLPDHPKEQALQKVNEIRGRIKSTAYLKNQGLELYMSASFGVATFPDDADDSEGLLALADEAMFRIKSLGKDAIGL